MGGIKFDSIMDLQQQFKPVEEVKKSVETQIMINKPSFQEILDGLKSPKQEEPKEEEKPTDKNDGVNMSLLAAQCNLLNSLISSSSKKKDDDEKRK